MTRMMGRASRGPFGFVSALASRGRSGVRLPPGPVPTGSFRKLPTKRCPRSGAMAVGPSLSPQTEK